MNDQTQLAPVCCGLSPELYRRRVNSESLHHRCARLFPCGKPMARGLSTLCFYAHYWWLLLA